MGKLWFGDSAGAVGDGEHAAEGKDGTERAGRIRLAQPRAVLGEEVLGPISVERSQHGAEPGALVPLEHRVITRQDVHVRRLPGVDLAAGPGQQLRIIRWV